MFRIFISVLCITLWYSICTEAFSHERVGTSAPRTTYEIDAGNGIYRGQLGAIDLCPDGTWAGEFELKYAPRQNLDDTCGNGVKLYCYDDNGFIGVYVTSSVGTEGDWQGIRRCAVGGHFIDGYSMNVEGSVGNFDDDLGIIDVRMECDDGEILDGLSSTTLALEHKNSVRSKTSPQDREFSKISVQGGFKGDKDTLDGEWGPLATCPSGTKVCGLQTQVEPVHFYDDDAGLCNMVLFCCSYP